jgi:hypothetical protein
MRFASVSGLSLSRMVTEAALVVGFMVAFTGLDKVTVKVSFGSTIMSSVIGMVKVVWVTPAVKVSVPETAI